MTKAQKEARRQTRAARKKAAVAWQDPKAASQRRRAPKIYTYDPNDARNSKRLKENYTPEEWARLARQAKNFKPGL